ncbi:MAG: type VI secretion system baseplate subunit TssG, partial [Pseudomonadota bacterium]
MADTTGRPATALAGASRSEPAKPPSVLEELLANPRSFSFLQAVRLLKQAHGDPGPDGSRSFLREQLRIRPYLSLGFPPTDLVEIVELPRDDDSRERDRRRRFRITATFLGLYGPSSPLPTFYTEELLDEQGDDKSVSRDFLDILNHGFFNPFVLADTHYNLSRLACEEGDEEILQRLFALVGLGHQEMLHHSFRNPGALLRA